MIKFLILFLLLLQYGLFSQDKDSLIRINSADSLAVEDTLLINGDSLIVKDSAAVNDTTALLDSIRTSVIVDTLHPVQQRVLFEGSTFIGQEIFKHIYSGYEGNYLQESEKVFIRDYSFIGYPDQEYYYGSNSISFLEDGLSLNSFNGFANTNNMLPESADSIEFIPSVRGALYGQSFNQTAINFITKDFLSQAPYTRIRYYEGPDGEAMVNGLFNSIFFNRLNIYTDVTNRSFDTRYLNTDLSSWQVKVKAKYFLSNKINLLGSYNFNRTISGLNGGVNVDSIELFSIDIEQYLYDEVLAPVNFRTRQLEEKQHLFRMRMLANAFGGSYSDFNIYYGFSLSRVYANEDLDASDLSLKNKTFGTLLDQRFQLNVFRVDLKGIFEHSDILLNSFSAQVLPQTSTRDFYSLSASASVNMSDSLITPSLFYRYGNTKLNFGDDQHTLGADIIVRPFQPLSIYAGYSSTDNFNAETRGSIFETGIFIRMDYFLLNAGLYNRESFSVFNSPDNQPYSLYLRYPVQINHTGITGRAEINIWKIHLSSSINYPFSADDKETGLPELTSRSGVFFKGLLFNGNLNLKAGFLFYYWGNQNLLNEQLINPVETGFSRYYVPRQYRVDFSMAGEIRQDAILFFTWENITGNEYYITPFYPMTISNIKFGLSWELFN